MWIGENFNFKEKERKEKNLYWFLAIEAFNFSIFFIVLDMLLLVSMLCKIAIMETITTISKNITKGEKLVVIPRKEYDELRELKQICEFIPTLAQKRALKRGRKNRALGNFLHIDELGRKLGIAN